MARLLTILAAAAAFHSLAPAAARAQTITWDMPNEYQESSLGGLADKDFIAAVTEKSGGKIVIQPHFGGSLGYKSNGHFSAVEDGAVPLAHTFGGVLVGVDPIFQINTLPFLVGNVDEMQMLVDVARPHIDAAFGKANQKLLYVTPWTPVGIWAKRPIRTIDELKTIKIRTYDVSGTMTLKEAGAIALQLSWVDVIPAFSTGTIDAVLTSDEGGIASKFWEYTDHFNQLNFTSGLDVSHINLDTFNGLSPELQQAVLDAAAQAEKAAWERLRARIGENVETMKTNGVTVVDDVTPELLQHLRTSGQVVVGDWLAKMGGKGEGILAEYKQRTGR
jgi:TRAP-type C4-dicarboxylate transport system substrate-binding protein